MALSSESTVSIVGTSAAITHAREMARKVAAGNAKVLITGESGVGKDLIARYIHANSARALRPFVAVNCAAVSDTLLESELFGHVKGSFTGAYRDKSGRMQLAHLGTIFLDEIGEMSMRMQALLLRFLENGEIQPVGSDRLGAKVDVRLVAATNCDLQELVLSGKFRLDLFYRIKVVHIHVPPLRERVEDIPPLADQMIQRIGRPLQFTDEALQLMRDYRWPGNIRELLSVIEQVSWLADSDLIGTEQLPPHLFTAVPRDVRCPTREQVIEDLFDDLVSGHRSFWRDVHQPFLNRDFTRDELRQLVHRALARVGGNYRRTLTLLGVDADDYKRLLNFLKAHDCVVDFRQYRPGRQDEQGMRSSA
jgi:transcriptional regulator with PAS, ATPase and Fis domain